eukprot:2059467-Rhodomonas_salina.2
MRMLRHVRYCLWDVRHSHHMIAHGARRRRRSARHIGAHSQAERRSPGREGGESGHGRRGQGVRAAAGRRPLLCATVPVVRASHVPPPPSPSVR